MYGGPVDVPAFEFLDKRTGTYRWFPRPWDAAAVEAAHARPGQGIVRGGRTYGCVFGGGADDTVLTFAHVLRPHAFWGRVGVPRPDRAVPGPGVAGREDVGRLAVGARSAGSGARSGTSAWAAA